MRCHLFSAILLATLSTQAFAETLVYEIVPEDAAAVTVDMEMVVRVISRRVNPGWILIPRGRVRAVGGTKIEISVFGDDPEKIASVRRMVESIGVLEFRILANRMDHASTIKRAQGEKGRLVLDEDGKTIGMWIPVTPGNEGDWRSDQEIVTRTTRRDGREDLEVLVVKDKFNVNGSYLSRVTAEKDSLGHPSVSFKLTAIGGRLLTGLTGSNLPDPATGFARKLGIILDGTLHSAPAVRSQIGRSGQITGRFTEQEVEELVAVLNAGTLPVRLRRVEPDEAPEGGKAK
jgi:SecD/SecF fusion protein